MSFESNKRLKLNWKSKPKELHKEVLVLRLKHRQKGLNMRLLPEDARLQNVN